MLDLDVDTDLEDLNGGYALNGVPAAEEERNIVTDTSFQEREVYVERQQCWNRCRRHRPPRGGSEDNDIRVDTHTHPHIEGGRGRQMGDAARGYAEEQLRRQALQLGLSDWKNDDDEAVGEEVIEANLAELEQIRTFAGLRGGVVGARVGPLDGFIRAHGEGDEDEEDEEGNEDAPPSPPTTTNRIESSKFWSPVELEELGFETLKVELSRLGLKCGGTLAERAKRLFAVRKVNGRLDQLDLSLFANNSNINGGGGGGGGGVGEGKQDRKNQTKPTDAAVCGGVDDCGAED